MTRDCSVPPRTSLFLFCSNHVYVVTCVVIALRLTVRSIKSRMEQKYSTISFISTPGFCSDCGSILPLLGDKGDVQCYACKRSWGPEAFGDMAMSYTVQFNRRTVYGSAKQKDDEEDEAEGPIVERKCPQCQNDKMSYATLQLRSADEGQTVFYTCTKCKFKETENS